MSEPEKLKLTTEDVLEERTRQLVGLFPEIRNQGSKIDFDRLKLALGETVDVGKERYGMTWPGKGACFKTIQTPSLGALRPQAADSINFDSTGNLIIEGDNLEVLKLLQKSYLGEVKMIYIDPPYNTGNDFIYPDDFSESLQTYLEYTGQVDAEGRRFGTNTEADGRFHSKWLNMMYPRLYLARNLLKDDGVIFISIDEHEVHNLRRICDEIYGEDNFVCTFVWEKRYSPPPDTKEVGYVHENILLYRKTPSFKMGLLPFTEDQQARYKNPDDDPRGAWKPMDYTCRYTETERPNLYYKIINPNTGTAVWPNKTRVWAYSQAVHKKNEKENRIWWGKDGNATVPALKNFVTDIRQGMMPTTLLKQDVVGNTDEATKELRETIPDLKYTPKPIRLIKHLCAIANVSSGDLILDFFAGTGTTALATLALNNESSSDLRFILVQLPEPTGRGDLPTISAIARERVRRAVSQMKKNKSADPKGLTLPKDLGFRAFTLAESNFTPWDAEGPKDASGLARQLELHVEHVRKGRSATDILYELLLKSGFQLTTAVEKKTAAMNTIYSVAGGALMICLDPFLTLELIRSIADMKPERVVCLDEGFAGNDQLKANAVQIFKTKGITSFKTV